jgi:putative component of membrane protein insertase Oxa1/YidC/SpoIIIJ protein YidD
MILSVFPSIFAASSTIAGENRSWTAEKDIDRRNMRDFFSYPAKGFLMGYQKFVGRGRQSTCPMSPSCSNYALEAVDRHGAFKAFFLAADRLHRCGHDLVFYPLVFTKKGPRRHDPVPAR